MELLQSWARLGVLAGAYFFLCSTVAAAADSFDILIRNGRIVDGAGNPWFRGDVGIRGDAIAAIGHLPGATAKRVILAGGRIVSPGFIDIHNHGRSGVFKVPTAENYVRQGVTTIIEGNDGGSPIPLQGLFDKLEGAGVAVNVGSFVGHGSIRREVIGREDRKATPEELDQMRNMTRRAMEQGALGLSTGLFYIPGAFAPTEEVVELAKVASEYGGMHISHMRDEADGLLDSVRETIEIGEKGGLPTQLTHHKALGPPNWGASRQSLELVEQARARGVDVSIDQYPYTASSTGSAALYPAWVQEGGRDELVKRLKDPVLKERIKKEVMHLIETNRGGGDPKNVQYAFCDWDTALNGKTLADVTRDRGRVVNFENAADTAMEIEIAGGCKTVYHAMKEEDVERIMQYPGTMISSDGEIPVFGEGVLHPRSYGTYARVLGRYVRERKLLPLEDAVRKMTSLPAQRIQQFDRGLLRPGMKADVTVFDEEKIIDRAEFGDPHQYAEGVVYVIVNGEVVLDDEKMTAARPGGVLYGQGRATSR
ncbi:MAG TPA: D-aminoacylase [Bryobacterales bacterium]|nr:D-aminoacylase [Bryobacterales bacterium]